MKQHTHQTYASTLLLLLLLQTAAGCSSDTDPTGEGTVPSDTASAAETVTEDNVQAEKEAYFAALPAISALQAEVQTEPYKDRRL